MAGGGIFGVTSGWGRGVSDWHLLGGDQGCCSTSYHTLKKYPALIVNIAKAEKS